MKRDPALGKCPSVCKMESVRGPKVLRSRPKKDLTDGNPMFRPSFRIEKLLIFCLFTAVLIFFFL